METGKSFSLSVAQHNVIFSDRTDIPTAEQLAHAEAIEQVTLWCKKRKNKEVTLEYPKFLPCS